MVRSVSPASRMDKRRRREGDPLLPPTPCQHFGGEIRASPQHTAVPAGYGSGKGRRGGLTAQNLPGALPGAAGLPSPSGAWEQERELKIYRLKTNKS